MREIRHWRVWGPPAVVLLFALIIAAGAVTLLIRPAPIAYSSASYEPERATVAPGETLYYTPTLIIRQGGYIRFVRSFWDIGRNQIALDCAGNATASIITERSLPPLVAGVIRGNIIKIKVPNLPPGEYELVTTAIGATGGQAWYTVKFLIKENCIK